MLRTSRLTLVERKTARMERKNSTGTEWIGFKDLKWVPGVGHLSFGPFCP